MTITGWILTITWEVLALWLVIWITVKRSRELRGLLTACTIGGYFTVFTKTRLLYSQFLLLPPASISLSLFQRSCTHSLWEPRHHGFLHICLDVQKFVLGPHLILGIGHYHAKLWANCDSRTNMISVAFQDRVHVSTSGSV